MIVSNIIGGLGNQMFQYACGYSLAKKLELELCLTTDMFDNYKLHNGYQLDNIFGISNKTLTNFEIYNFLGLRGSKNIRRVLSKNIASNFRPKKWIQEESIRYFDQIKTISSNAYLHGYWQSEKYFKNYEDDIKEIFSFENIDLSNKDKEIIKSMKNNPSVSLHIRRGDYTNKKNQNIFNILDVNYYLNALNNIKRNYPEYITYIFTDDPEWVSNNIIKELKESVLVSHNKGEDSFKDMILMSNADHNIIANSSFSWWGAWLNNNPEKIVIAPKIWFIDDISKSLDIVPESWHLI